MVAASLRHASGRNAEDRLAQESIAAALKVGSVSNNTVERLAETSTTRPTRPAAATTGIPTATPLSAPRMTCTDSSKLDDDVSTTWAETVAVAASST